MFSTLTLMLRLVPEGTRISVVPCAVALILGQKPGPLRMLGPIRCRRDGHGQRPRYTSRQGTDGRATHGRPGSDSNPAGPQIDSERMVWTREGWRHLETEMNRRKTRRENSDTETETRNLPFVL